MFCVYQLRHRQHQGLTEMGVLNGWQRLWIVVTVVLGVAVASRAVDRFPTEADVDQSYQQEMSRLEEIKNEILHPPEDKLRKMLSRAGEYTIKSVIDAKVDAGRKYEASLKSLPSRQSTIVVQALIFWVAASGLLYGAGLTLIWVIRGFRPKEKPIS
jgi:hypothetical protein